VVEYGSDGVWEWWSGGEMESWVKCNHAIAQPVGNVQVYSKPVASESIFRKINHKSQAPNNK
jgi:hypothetical protein